MAAEIGVVMRVDPNDGEEHLEEKNRDRDNPDRIEDLLFENERTPPVNHGTDGAVSPWRETEKFPHRMQARFAVPCFCD